MHNDDEDDVKMVRHLYRVLCLYTYDIVHLCIQMHVAVHHVHQISACQYAQLDASLRGMFLSYLSVHPLNYDRRISALCLSNSKINNCFKAAPRHIRLRFATPPPAPAGQHRGRQAHASATHDYCTSRKPGAPWTGASPGFAPAGIRIQCTYNVICSF